MIEDEDGLNILDYVYKTPITVPENVTMDVVAVLDKIYTPISSQYIIDGVNKLCRESSYKCSVVVKEVAPDVIFSEVADSVVIVSILGNNEDTRSFLSRLHNFVRTSIAYDLDGASKFNETRSLCMSEE